MTRYLQMHNGVFHQLYGNLGSFVISSKLPRNIICIIGNSSDKTKEYLSNHICNKYFFRKMRIDDPIKEVAKALFDFNNPIDKVDHRWSVTPKQAMKFIEKDMLENKIMDLLPYIDKNFLAHLAYYKICNSNSSYVISDLKTENEYNVLSRLNPYIIKLNDRTKIEEKNKIPYHLLIINNGDKYSIIEQFDHDFHL